MGQAITYLVENFLIGPTAGLLSLMTVIVRIIILPLGISQSKKQCDPITEKMQALKPQVEATQQKIESRDNSRRTNGCTS